MTEVDVYLIVTRRDTARTKKHKVQSIQHARGWVELMRKWAPNHHATIVTIQRRVEDKEATA